MPQYEYETMNIGPYLDVMTMDEFFNEKGAAGWRMVHLNLKPDSSWATFERKIEINDKLREIQLGVKQNEKDQTGESEPE